MKKVLLGLVCAMSFNFAHAQIGVGTDVPQATLDIKGKPGDKESIDGVIAPRVTGNQLREKNNVYTTAQNGAIVYVTEADSAPAGKTVKVTSPGYFYYSHPEGQNVTGIWERMDSSSKFFYMPSIALPTTAVDPRLDVNNTLYDESFSFNNSVNVYKVDLYKIFKNQFEKPVASSTLSKTEIQNLNCVENPIKGLCGFVLSKDKYEYYVTFIDKTLFSDVSVTENGELYYQVDPTRVIRTGSFMNVVLKVK